MRAKARGKVLVGTEIFATVEEPAALLEAEGFEVELNPYNRRLVREDYSKVLKNADYVLAGLEPYDAAIFERFPQLRVISRIGIGLDSIDLEAATTHNVAVYNTPAAPSQSVAELTVGLMVALARGVAPMNADFHRNEWRPVLGRELASLTIGLLGFGCISRMVAERLQAFRPRVIGHDIVWDNETAARYGVEKVDFDVLLSESDVLSIHIPLAESTRHLLNGPRLDRMKNTAFLINTSRGGIIDDDVLLERLRSGSLAGAALDVFEYEPDTTRYAGAPNLVALPHVGANTVEARLRMELGAVQNVIAYVEAIERGVPPPAGPLH